MDREGSEKATYEKNKKNPPKIERMANLTLKLEAVDVCDLMIMIKLVVFKYNVCVFIIYVNKVVHLTHNYISLMLISVHIY